MAYESGMKQRQSLRDLSARLSSLSDRDFFILLFALFGAVTLAIIAFLCAFMQGMMGEGDTNIFYLMADVIVRGGTPYVGFQDVKPPLIFFALAVPDWLGVRIAGGIALTCLCNMASALLLAVIGWKLYGRLPGLAAGVLFMVNMALAQGYSIITEPFALPFILLTAYALIFLEKPRKYLVAGICAGIAIGFKQYALLVVPLSLFYLYRKGELRGVPSFLAGTLLPLLLIFGAIFLVYGVHAGEQSLYWSFGVADSYVTSDHVQEVSTFPAPSVNSAAVEFLVEACLFATLLILGTVSVLAGGSLSVEEEFFAVSAMAFVATLLVRQYLHYWAFAIPFAILLIVRLYRRTNEEAEPVGV